MRCSRGHGHFVRSSFKPELRRGFWSPDEDNILFNYIIKNGIQGCTWSYIAKQAGLQRCGKSCRLRWFNYLRPGLKRGAISAQEEQLIIDLHSIIGNRWCQIAACLPGRTDSEIKNYWNSSIKKRLNLKQNPFSNNTKSDIPFQFDTTCVTNPVSLHPPVLSHDAYSYSHSAQPLQVMPRGYQLRQNYKTLDVAATAVEDQNHQFAINQDLTINQLICDSSSIHTGRKTFYDAFTCPSLQAQDDTHKTEKPFSCHQLLSRPPPHEASVSANNSVSSTINSTIPPLIDISDSLEGNTENDGEIIWENKNENEIIFDYSCSASSCGIAAWRANSYSNTTDFIDCYPETVGNSILEDEASQRERSSSQFSPPLAMVWADLDQYSNVQAEDDNKDCIYFGVPSYINSHTGQSISCQAGVAQDGDPYPSTFGIECEGEDTIWVEDLYNIFHTDIAAFSSR